MDYAHIAHIILDLRAADLALRDALIERGALGDGYHPDMEALHNQNAGILSDIIDEIGYPTADKVGEAASHAAWLVIQHAIGQPAFMRRCADLLARAVADNLADPMQLAHLTDRIAVLSGLPQRYGTQFDWDAHGDLSPNPIDDPADVNARRLAIGLNSMEAQTAVIRARARLENQYPPADPLKRKREMDAWRKHAGWIPQRGSDHLPTKDSRKIR